MRPFCPCRDCRPTGMGFKKALSLSRTIGEIRQFGAERAKERTLLKVTSLAGFQLMLRSRTHPHYPPIQQPLSGLAAPLT